MGDRDMIEQVLQILCAASVENSQEKHQSDLAKAIIQFMDEMPGGFLIYYADRGEEIVYANRSLLRIFNCDTMEQFRRHTQNSFRGLVHPDDLDEVEDSIQEQIAASQYDLDYVEYRIRRTDGELRWIEDYGHFVHSESVGDIFYVFLSDATEKHNQMLEEKNKMLAESLKRANLAIESKNAFLSNLSHDMRTPLNAIFGFTSLTKLNLDNPLEAEEYLQQVESASRLLLNMIEKALAVSSLSGDAELEEKECDLRIILQKVCESMQSAARDKNITLKLDCAGLTLSAVYSDGQKLQQLLHHVVENAIIYNKRGGEVQVSVKEQADTSNKFAVYDFVVRDTGIGISEENIERIFEPFTRVKNSTQSGVHAIGLGLSISKSIAEMLGGSISVQSELGEGSTFTIRLALRLQPQQPEPLPQPEQQLAAPALNILLVEDNDINREIEMELLQRMGFVVHTVENGQQALELMRKAAPGDYDLILMDLQMPVMDGWQAAKEIRALPDQALAKLPIIALSANVSEYDQKKSQESGIDAHLLKPMDLPLLRQTIKKLTGK